MRVLVTGSRDYENFAVIFRDLFDLDMGLRADQKHPNDRLTVIHGRCPTGADKHARKIANILGANLYEFPAEWDHYGKAAGNIRNAEMLKTMKPDVVYAYPLPQSKGTFNMIALARAAGVPVVVR